MKIRCIVAIAVLLALSFYFTRTVLAEEDGRQTFEEAIKQNIEKNIHKDLGPLPNSPLYFSKRFSEFWKGVFVFGNRKTSYLFNLSQKRLEESYLMTKDGKNGYAKDTLSDYIKISQKLKKRNLKNHESDLSQNYFILQVINLADNKDIKELTTRAFLITSSLMSQAQEQNEETETEDLIQGMVLEIYPDYLILKYEAKELKLRVDNYKNAQFEGKPQEELKEGASIAIVPKDKKIKYAILKEGEKTSRESKLKDFDGYLTAEKISIK